MEKEKVLEMSRKENKDRDIVAQEAEKRQMQILLWLL